MRVILIVLMILLSGCVTKPFSAQRRVNSMGLTQDQRDEVFLTAQLYIFANNMEKAEQELTYAVRNLTGVQALEFRLMLARVETQLNKVESAYKRYMSMVSEFPMNESVFREAGHFLYGIRLKDDAYVLYSKLVRINPKQSNYWIYRGLLALELGKVKEAWESFDFLIHKSVDAKHLGHFYMGKLIQMTGSEGEAIFQFKKCLKIKPKTKDCSLELARELYDLGRKKRAIKVIDKYLDKYKFYGNEELVEQLVGWHIQEGDLQSAIACFQNLERIKPTDIRIKRRVAMLMVKNKNYIGALKRMKLILSYEESDEQDSLNYINTLRIQGDEALAYSYILSILDLGKVSERFFFLKYEMDRETKGFKKASKELIKGCKKSLNNKDCFYIYAYVLWNDGDKKRTIKKLEAIVRKNKNSSHRLEYFLGRIYYEEGKEQKALKLIDKIILEDESYAEALNFKAYYLAKKDLDMDEAEKLSLKALSKNSRNGYYLDTYGYILAKKGQFKKAIIILKEAARLSPQEPEILEHIAYVYTQVKNTKEAIRFYVLASKLYKGENQVRIGGKIAKIRSKNKVFNRGPSSSPASIKHSPD